MQQLPPTIFSPIIYVIRILLPFVITIFLLFSLPQYMVSYAVQMWRKGEYIWVLLPIIGVPISVYMGFWYIRRRWGFDAFPYLKRGFKGIGEGGKALFSLIWETEKTKKQPKATTDRPITLYTNSKDIIELYNPYRGVFVVGANGSGKSESIAIPLLSEFIRKDFCGLIYDFKFPSLANEVEYLKAVHNNETPHYYVDFVNPLHSHRVNPIAPKYLLNTTYAREFASSIINNLMKESIQKPDFWSRSATDVLTACIWYLKEHHPDKCDLPHVCAMVTSNGGRLIQTLAKDPITAQMTTGIRDAMERKSEGQVSGVLGSLQSAIAQINTPELMYVLGADDFSLDLNNPENPSFVTIGSNPTLPTSIAPLASLIISVTTKMMNQPNKKKSFFLFDEMPTCYVPNIEILPNTGRSNKIATIFMIQDLAQLNDGYGDKKADVIFAACNNHFYGKVTSPKTTEVLSKQLGKEDRAFTTHSQNKGSNMNSGGFGMNTGQSQAQSIQEREIMRPAEFTQLGVGEFVAVLADSNWKWTRQNMKNIKGERMKWQPIATETDLYEYYRNVSKEVDEILVNSESSLKTHENSLKKEVPNPTETEEAAEAEAFITDAAEETPPPIEDMSETAIEKYFREQRESQSNSSL